MTHTLRTTAKRWLIEICASISPPLYALAMSVFLYFLPFKEGGRGWIVAVIVVVSIVILVKEVADTLSLLLNKIVIDDQAISGQINEECFSLRWKEVIAVWDSKTQYEPCLNVGARDGKVTIPLKFFNEKLLRDLIRLHVAPQAFEKDAIKLMPGYRFRHAANETVIREAADKSLRVGGMAFFKGLGWVIALLFLCLAAWFWLSGIGAVSLVFLLLAALQTHLVLVAAGSMEMNKDFVTYITPISRRRIGWDEVTEVETDWTEAALVFIGPNKRLKVVGPRLWSGKDKERMLRLFSAQVENRGIDVKRRYTAIWHPNKNTKVNSKSQ
jgi:hypothetical protein